MHCLHGKQGNPTEKLLIYEETPLNLSQQSASYKDIVELGYHLFLSPLHVDPPYLVTPEYSKQSLIC